MPAQNESQQPAGSGETGNPPLSLAEQAMTRVEERLLGLFSESETADSFTFRQAAILLETDPVPFVAATIAEGIYPSDLAPTLLGTMNKGTVLTELAKYTCSRDQLLRLNRHPYMRTEQPHVVCRQLGVSAGMLAELVNDLDMEPMLPKAVIRTSSSDEGARSGARFDADQVATLAKAAERYDPPEGADLVAEAQLLKIVAPGVLEVVKHELQIKAHRYRNRTLGENSLYVTAEQARQIIKTIIANRASKK